ncbi:DNA polymerase eta [Uranotaenia lowii]|uniref:DNA polymerase eta n=1 Tax=Uranotaenia lowii TaxID=190385 RepID=UPI002478380A|nr:DNA polymerase eta [Uranotaenia lowii]
MSTKQFININNKYDRVVVLVDMDCFYCQVEEKLNPTIRGKPIAVVQYNPWQGGGIIAVNYPARAKGVTRHMRGDEAKKHCPDIVLPQVPQVRGKADISKYRDAGKEVAAVLQTFTPLLERASVDEAYMDITERVLARLKDMNEGKFQLLPDKLANTFAVGYESVGHFVQKISGDLDDGSNSQELESEEDRVAYKKSDIKLLIGASIVNEIRAAVKEKTGYECSAGIAHNKILAKLTAGFHKPNKQTILPLKSISTMYQTLSIKKVKGLGGKLGDQVCEILKIQNMAELANIPEKVLQNHFEERMGSWMHLIAKGIDLEAVTPKFNAKSIGCCKRFPGKNAITGLATLKHWLSELSNEIQERLEKDMEENNRTARQMTVSYAQQFGDNDVSSTRSVPLVVYEAGQIATDALEAIKRNTDIFLKADNPAMLNNSVKFLGISAGKFEDNSNVSKKNGLKAMFSNIANKAGQTQIPQTNICTKLSESNNQYDESLSLCEVMDNASDKKSSNKEISNFFQNTETYENLENSGREKFFDEGKKCSKPSIANFFSKIKTSTNETEDSVAASKLKQQDVQSTEHEANKNENEMRSEDESYLNSTQPLIEDELSIIDPTKPDLLEEDPIQLSSEKTENKQVAEKISVIEIKSVDRINQQVIQAETSSLSSLDYRQTYAEFYRSPVTLPNMEHPQNVQICSDCGKQVPSKEMQSHRDFHLALQLSQQQREKFRIEMKQKFSCSPVTVSKPKTTFNNSKVRGKSLLIDKFLTANPPTSQSSLLTEPLHNASASASMEVCNECRKSICSKDMQEHLDYHIARKIQLELNQRDMIRATGASGSSSTLPLTLSQKPSGNQKRKRSAAGGSAGSSDARPPVKLKNLSTYFTKL